MEDKTQYEALMEELQKIANNIIDVFTELGDALAKILPDVEIPDEEEDAWEMKCPYVYGDNYFVIEPSGYVCKCSWDGLYVEEEIFNQGHIFSTKEEAELEVKRRNLLTRFRAFRDECNGDWKINWDEKKQDKHIIKRDTVGNLLVVKYWMSNEFNTFGYFKDYIDAERAIELFGDEIKELFVEGEED